MENNNIFTISPMNQRISLEPGKVFEGSITVINPVDATEDFYYKAIVEPYSVADGGYEADLVTESDRTTITNWIEIAEPNGVLKPNESKVIHFTITVPENAPAGGQYAAIAVSSDTEAANNGGITVQNIYEIASIIYATVAGETIHEGAVQSNFIPGFVLATPVTLSATLSNSGNIHETATFTITATDFFTGNVILPNNASSGRYTEIVMPESTRYVEREIDNLPMFGVVKITQTISYNGQTSTEEKSVIICPIWLLAFMALLISTIIIAIVHLIKTRHRRRAVALQ